MVKDISILEEAEAKVTLALIPRLDCKDRLFSRCFSSMARPTEITLSSDVMLSEGMEIGEEIFSTDLE